MASPGPKKLTEILEENGAPAELHEFLKAKGITTVAILAYYADTADQLFASLAEPLASGTTVNGSQFKYDGDLTLLKAVILASWEDCREFRKLAICGQVKAAPGAASAPKPPNRPPKSLGLGIWTAQIAKYEAAYTPQRVFPAKLLLGAETVLARLIWEADTKMYTPLK